ncbi:hypothetical protein MLD38_029568 [Melastoma candidum]|uniref:Uncharacterized protein n=1 Tax=Melastoma candidum TaxID=119954 RepID=A0ACB9N446_9MYRT|nr:hypothetical protein MLD38_029568 [Melastoma candidum]
MSAWDHLGEAANLVQLSGLDAVRLIGMIVRAANTARMHKKNCRQFALHLKLIGGLLEQLKISELKKYPETREPLEHLEDALRRSYVLVQSCQDRSYLYLLAMGWNIVYQFRKAQNEIDRYLKLVPLITLVDNARVRERLEVIDRDQREYTLDDDDQKAQTLIFSHDPYEDNTQVLKKSLSCSYPDLRFDEALKKENKKLQLEFQRSQANLDVGQCEVIQRLIDLTETVVVTSLPENGSPVKTSKQMDKKFSVAEADANHAFSESYPKKNDAHHTSRNMSVVSRNHDLVSRRGSYGGDEWHADLLDCCSEPLFCMWTLFCPCRTFSKIATVATGRHMSPAEACNDLMAYSLILSCCCYTCCIRRKLRKMLSIKGGWFDDFLSHVMCCCCSLIQEHREIEIRGIGPEKTKTSPPKLQNMES